VNREHWGMMPDMGKLKYSAENLSQFHFVNYNKPSFIEPGPLLSEK
jgi:hypothetical protein